MAITIQTERELRKYLFESFLKEQQRKKSGLLLQEEESKPQTSIQAKTSQSGDEEKVLKDIPASVVAREKAMKDATQKLLALKSQPTTWENINSVLSSAFSNTAITYDKYPASLSSEYIDALEKLKDDLRQKNKLSNSYDELPLPSPNADPNDFIKVNMMFKLFREPFSLEGYIEPKDYKKINEFNETSISKLYSNGESIYLAIPIYINKDKIEQSAFTDEQSIAALRLGDLTVKTLQMPNSNYKFENAILQDDIETGKLKNWRYLSFYNALLEIDSNPIFNVSIEIPKWDEEASRKAFGNDKKRSINMQSLIKKVDRPALNSFQLLDQQYYEDIALNINKGRLMLFYGTNKDEGFNWTPYGVAQNFNALFWVLWTKIKESRYIETFDNRCQILSDEFRKNYYSTSQDMYMKQLQEIREQLMTADLQLATGETLTDAAVPLYPENIFKKLELKDLEALTHDEIADKLKDYLGNTFDEFELQQFIQLLQLKRTQNASLNWLKYSSEYSLKPEYANIASDSSEDALDKALNELGLEKTEKNLIKPIIKNEEDAPGRNLTKQEYDALIKDNNGKFYNKFYMRTSWRSYDNNSESSENQNVDILDRLIAWDTGKSALTKFFSPMSAEDLDTYKKGANRSELAKETVGIIGMQTAADTSQLALIPWQLSGNPYTMAGATIASAALSFGSWWNRGGYINFIENKTSEIQKALEEFETSELTKTDAIDGIINDLRKNNIEFANISDENISNDQKIKILNTLLKRMSLVETLEQFMWAFDMIGWIPVVSTLSKPILLRRMATYKRQALQAGDVVPQQIKTHTGRFIDSETGTVYKSVEEARAANVSNDKIEPEMKLETVNIDPDNFHTVTSFIPTKSNQYKAYIMGAIDTAIEKIYTTLFLPFRELGGEKLYTVKNDLPIDHRILKQGESITADEYQQILAKHGKDKQYEDFFKQNLVLDKNTQKWVYQGPNDIVVDLSSNIKKGTKLSSKNYENLKDAIFRNAAKDEQSVAVLKFAQNFKANITFDEFYAILKNIEQEQGGFGQHTSIYENLVNFSKNYESAAASSKGGVPIDFDNFKKLYCDYHGLNPNILPNNEKIIELLNKIDPNVVKQAPFIESLKKQSIKAFLDEVKTNPALQDFKMHADEFSKYLKLAEVNLEKYSAYDVIFHFKNNNQDLDSIYAFRLFKKKQNYNMPVMDDYASSYELIKELPIKDYNTFWETVLGPKRFSQYKRVKNDDQAGFKMSQKEYNALSKELRDNYPGTDITQYVQYNKPKIPGGYNAYKKQMSIFIDDFNKSKLSELDYVFSNCVSNEFGSNRIFATFDKKELNQTFSELHQINDLMKTGMLNLEEKSLSTIIGGLKDWLSDYEKFFNYLLLSKYSQEQSIDMMKVYDDYLSSGALGLKDNTKKVSKFEAIRSNFAELRARLQKTSFFKKLNIDSNEEKLAGRSVVFDNQTLVNKGLVTYDELGKARTFFTEISTNYPSKLLEFKKGLEQWQKTFDNFYDKLNQFASSDTALRLNPAQREQLTKFLNHIDDIKRNLTNATQEISRSNFFAPKVFNFNKNNFNFLHQAFHLSRIQSGSFIALRQWFENFQHWSGEGWQHYTRLIERLAILPTPVLSQLTELFKQVYDAINFVLKSENIKGFKDSVLAFSKIVRTNMSKWKEITDQVVANNTGNTMFVALFFGENILNVMKLGGIIVADLIINHPLFAITMSQYIVKAVMLNDIKTAEDISKNFQFNNGVIYPMFISTLARMKGNVMLSGNADLIKQFKALGNSQIMPHFAIQQKLINTMSYVHEKNTIISKAKENKAKFNANIQSLSTSASKNQKINSEQLDKIFTEFQSQNVILKHNESEKFSDLISNNNYSGVITLIQRDNKKNSKSLNITLDEVTAGGNKIQTINLGEEVIYLNERIEGEQITAKKKEFNDLGLSIELFESIYVSDPRNNQIFTLDAAQVPRAIKSWNKYINEKNENNNNYTFNKVAYEKLNANVKTKFKKDFFAAINAQQDLNKSISKKMFKMDVWVKNETTGANDTNTGDYIKSQAGLFSEYQNMSKLLKKTFYFYASDLKAIETSPRGTVGYYWQHIIKRNKNSAKIVNDQLIDKLAFLDFYNTLKKEDEFKEIQPYTLTLTIGLLKNYLKEASKDSLQKNSKENPFINFKISSDTNNKTISVNSDILKIYIEAVIPSIFKKYQAEFEDEKNYKNITGFSISLIEWIRGCSSDLISMLPGSIQQTLPHIIQKGLRDISGSDKIQELSNALANASANAAQQLTEAITKFMTTYHTLYAKFLNELGIYELFSGNTLSNYDRVDHFIVFLEGVALIKHCQITQSLLNSFKSAAGIPDIEIDESNKIQQLEKSKRTIIKDHHLDVFSMLTSGIHSVKYTSSIAQNTDNKKNEIDLSEVDIVVNPVFINMPDNSQYLDIIDGTDDDPLDTLADKNLRALAYEYDLSAYFTTKALGQLPSAQKILNETRLSLNAVEKTFNEIFNDDDYLKNLGDSKFPAQKFEDIQNQPEPATEQQDTAPSQGADNANIKVNEGKIMMNGKKNQKFIFKIEEPLKILIKEAPTSKKSDTSVISKMIKGDSQVQSEQLIIKKNQEMFKKYLENLKMNKEINLDLPKLEQVDSKNILDSSQKNIQNVLSLRDSLNLDVNYQISQLIENPSSLQKMTESINITLNMMQKYNFDDEIFKGLKPLLKKYLQVLPIIERKLQKVKEGIKKGNLNLNNNADIQQEFNKIFEIGIVKYTLEKKSKVILKRKINQIIDKNFSTEISNEDLYKYLNDNNKDSSSKTVIAFKLKRVLYIISKFIIPMVKKINNATQSNQKINFEFLLKDYINNILNTYKNSIEEERKEGQEYINFLKAGIMSGGTATDKILDYSYIIGYEKNKKSGNINKLIILSDLSNLKNNKTDSVEFINDFIFDIPYVYQIDLTEIMSNNKNIEFVAESFDMENIKIKLIETEVDDVEMVGPKWTDSNNNFVSFNVYRFKKDRTDLINMLKENKVFIENYTQNTIFSL